jgi:hypothetical protein
MLHFFRQIPMPKKKKKTGKISTGGAQLKYIVLTLHFAEKELNLGHWCITMFKFSLKKTPSPHPNPNPDPDNLTCGIKISCFLYLVIYRMFLMFHLTVWS